MDEHVVCRCKCAGCRAKIGVGAIVIGYCRECTEELTQEQLGASVKLKDRIVTGYRYIWLHAEYKADIW